MVPIDSSRVIDNESLFLVETERLGLGGVVLCPRRENEEMSPTGLGVVRLDGSGVSRAWKRRNSGTVRYFCSFRTSLTGRVEVEPKVKPSGRPVSPTPYPWHLLCTCRGQDKRSITEGR